MLELDHVYCFVDRPPGLLRSVRRGCPTLLPHNILAEMTS